MAEDQKVSFSKQQLPCPEVLLKAELAKSKCYIRNKGNIVWRTVRLSGEATVRSEVVPQACRDLVGGSPSAQVNTPDAAARYIQEIKFQMVVAVLFLNVQSNAQTWQERSPHGAWAKAHGFRRLAGVPGNASRRVRGTEVEVKELGSQRSCVPGKCNPKCR